MSKYQLGDLTSAYDDACSEIDRTFQSYRSFLDSLTTGLEVYLQAQQEIIVYYNQDGKRTDLHRAMQFGKGGCSVIVGIDLKEGRQTERYLPADEIMFPIFLQIKPEATSIEFNSEKFWIRKGTVESDRKEFYEFLLKKIMEHYQQLPAYFLEHGTTPKMIGEDQEVKANSFDTVAYLNNQ